MDNFLLMCDSYKMSHWPQYPKNTDGYFGYVEARGCKRGWTFSQFVGLQIFRLKYLSKPFIRKDIDEVEKFMKLHGEPFNREGWDYILDKYNGYIPVTIKAVPEGTKVGLSNVLCTVECLDPICFWVGSWIETALLRSIWYSTTVSTLSKVCKNIIKEEMEKTCDNLDGLPFKLHDFGARGVSSSESAQIGGCSHLVNFMGSDTIEGIWTANKYYDIEMAGFSIPAAEHSTITSWGMTKEDEIAAYDNMLNIYAKPGTILAVVSDSTDIYWACETAWGEFLKQKVIDSGATLVVRPDSGEPEIVTLKCIEILGDKFGYTLNSKGYKVLNPCVRLIQGDGVNERSIRNILANFRIHGWSADNIAFGMGGALLQGIDRDTLEFAMKCSAIRIKGIWYDVQKNPVTDSGKKSKAGRISLYQLGHGVPLYATYRQDFVSKNPEWEDKKVYVPEVLEIVYELIKNPVDGYKPVNKKYSFEEVRNNSNK